MHFKIIWYEGMNMIKCQIERSEWIKWCYHQRFQNGPMKLEIGMDSNFARQILKILKIIFGISSILRGAVLWALF